MGRASGNVSNKTASVNLRRKQAMSETIVISNGSTANLVIPLVIAPTNSRIAINRIVFYNKLAINDNSTNAAWTIGTATAAGSLTANNILTIPTATFNSAFQNTAIHKQNVFTTADMASTLKTAKAPHLAGRPIVPAGNAVVATIATMATNGTGAVKIAVDYWEIDDENG